MKKVRAGNLKHQVILQREVSTKDATGAVVTNFINLVITNASIQPVKGDERYINNNLLSEVDTIVEFRYPAIDIKNLDRIIHGSKIYDIYSVVNEYELNRNVVVLAKYRMNDEYCCIEQNITTEAGVAILTESGLNLTTE